jgi:hypothetical protein
VSEAAVSKRVKRLNIDVTRHVGLERAKAVAERGLDVVDQLRRINGAIQEELTWALAEARKPEGERKGLQAAIVTLSGEIRKQLGLQLDVIRTLYDVREMEVFQREVIDAIGEVAPEVRETILRRRLVDHGGRQDHACAGILCQCGYHSGLLVCNSVHPLRWG